MVVQFVDLTVEAKADVVEVTHLTSRRSARSLMLCHLDAVEILRVTLSGATGVCLIPLHATLSRQQLVREPRNGLTASYNQCLDAVYNIRENINGIPSRRLIQPWSSIVADRRCTAIMESKR